MPAGFVKYLPSARMDCTVPRFAVSCRWYAVSRDLLRFGWLSSDSTKYKGASCVQGIECVAQNRQKRKKPCAALNTQHRAKVDLEMSKWVELFTMLNFCRNTFSRFSNCRIFFFPSSISACSSSRVFSLGFVIVGRSFLPIGTEKGQSISRLSLVVYSLLVSITYQRLLLLHRW